MSFAAQPSATVRKAAQAAAASPHGYVNLVRLIGSLDKNEPISPDERDVNNSACLKKQWETIKYARILLDTLQSSGQGSSTSPNTFHGLDNTLKSIETRYRAISELSEGATPVALTNGHTQQSPYSIRADIEGLVSAEVVQPDSSADLSPMTPSINSRPSYTSSKSILRPRRTNVEEYLSIRASEDLKGDETGLLPLKISKSKSLNEPGARDRLLGGPRAGIGSAQLHEELGGQLADMSHRLKLNALHFANSLEDEKSMLDTSTDVLEKNLSATRSSKKNLSAVSSKGRGTTCMTLGIVILVLIIFVWTYMLIRFT